MTTLTVEEVAKRLKKKRQAVLLAIRSGRLNAQKIGRMWFIREEDIELLIDKRFKEYRKVKAAIVSSKKPK